MALITEFAQFMAVEIWQTFRQRKPLEKQTAAADTAEQNVQAGDTEMWEAPCWSNCYPNEAHTYFENDAKDNDEQWDDVEHDVFGLGSIDMDGNERNDAATAATAVATATNRVRDPGEHAVDPNPPQDRPAAAGRARGGEEEAAPAADLQPSND